MVGRKLGAAEKDNNRSACKSYKEVDGLDSARKAVAPLKWHRHDSERSLSLEDQTRQRAPGATRLASKRTRGTE